MDRDALFEQVVGAWRETDTEGRIRAAPAFYDLDEADRVSAFDATLVQRSLEAAIDAEGLSSTARAVLARIGRP